MVKDISIKRLQFRIGDVLYPAIDLTDLPTMKSIKITARKFSAPLLLNKGFFQIQFSCKLEGDYWNRPYENTETYEVLEPFLLYGVAQDKRLFVQTRGQRKRATSIKRLEQLHILRRIEKSKSP